MQKFLLFTSIASLLISSYLLFANYFDSNFVVSAAKYNSLTRSDLKGNGSVSSGSARVFGNRVNSNATTAEGNSSKLIIVTKVNCLKPQGTLLPCDKLITIPTPDRFIMHLYMFEGFKFVDESGGFPGSDQGWSFPIASGTQYKVGEANPHGEGLVHWSVETQHFTPECEGSIAANQTKTCTVTNDISVYVPPPMSGGGVSPRH